MTTFFIMEHYNSLCGLETVHARTKGVSPMVELRLARSLRQDVRQDLRQDLRQGLHQDLRLDLRPVLRHGLRNDLRQDLRLDLRHDLVHGLRHDLRQDLRPDLRQDLRHSLRHDLRRDLRQSSEARRQPSVGRLLAPTSVDEESEAEAWERCVKRSEEAAAACTVRVAGMRVSTPREPRYRRRGKPTRASP